MRSHILDLLLRAQKRPVFSQYKQLLKLQYAPSKDIRALQKKRLEQLLLYAATNSSYYEKVLSKAGIYSNGKIHMDSFTKIPLLTKQILKKEFDSIKIKAPGQYSNSSGGSTGSPVQVVQDRNVWTQEMATKWLFFSFICKFPARHVKVWGSEHDFQTGGKRSVSNDLKNWLYQRHFINAFDLSDNTIQRFVQILEENRPAFIEAYVDALYEVTKKLSSEKYIPPSLQGIITSAGTLHDHMREEMQEFWKCPVLNRFGGREVGDIACSCKKNTELHYDATHLVVEVLDDKGTPCPPGVMGNIHITSLSNYSMPLIRYEIGDRGALSDNSPCPCGRTLPRLARVSGRAMTAFRTTQGNIVPGEFFIHFMGVVHKHPSVEKFQVVQKSFDKLEVLVVADDTLPPSVTKEISSSFRQAMGEHCKISWRYVDDIQALPSGKYVYTRSEIT